METLLTKKDIDLLRDMYSKELGEPWEYRVGQAYQDCEGACSYYYYHDNISLLLSIFHGISFSSSGIMYVRDLSNPVKHSIERLSKSPFVSERKNSLQEKKALIYLFNSPLHVAVENMHHAPFYSPAIASYKLKLQRVSCVSLIAEWRIKIGK